MNLTLVATDFGPAFAGFVPAKSTSALTVADLEGDPCAVDILAAVKEFRFERGYNRDWVKRDGADGDLDTSVGSYVEIYPDAAAAHGKFAFDQSSATKPPPAACDVHVNSTTTFPVSAPPGEEAFGYRHTITNNDGTQMTYTWTEFRRGRVVASTDVIRTDARDTANETTQFAHTLDANISRLLNIP